MKVYNSGGDSRYVNAYTKANLIKMENWVDLKLFHEIFTTSEIESRPGISGWEPVEMYMKLSETAGKGIYRVWRKGKLIFEDTKTNTLLHGGGSYVSQAYIFTFYSNNPSPVEQSTFIDDVFITNERPSNTDSNGNPYIGVGDVATLAPPNPPSVD